jgi:hypothetical protein
VGREREREREIGTDDVEKNLPGGGALLPIWTATVFPWSACDWVWLCSWLYTCVRARARGREGGRGREGALR